MNFARTETQTMLADMLARLLADENEFETRRRRLSAPLPDRLALWPSFAAQGLLGAVMPEDIGGFGGAVRELAVLMEQTGARLVIEPLLASAVCSHGLLAAGAEEEAVSLLAGERIFIFAHTEGGTPFALPTTVAVEQGDRIMLSGTKTVIRHADLADEFIVSAMFKGKPGCFLVEAGAPGVGQENLRLLDASSAATLTFDNAPARYLAGETVLETALLWSFVGLAAEVAGIISILNEKTFAYLCTRKQFGVPIASFQALQHRAAEMFAAVEEVRALVDRAIDAIDMTSAGRFALASAVKALADDAGRKVGHEAVQMHGGMGVSDELDVSHYMRRLATIRAEFGSADVHRARFATLTERTAHAA